LDGGYALRGTVFLLVQKDGEERARQGEGLLQSRPSPWTLILRSLWSMRVQRMRVRDASLRSPRTEPCGWECRVSASRCPICHS